MFVPVYWSRPDGWLQETGLILIDRDAFLLESLQFKDLFRSNNDWAFLTAAHCGFEKHIKNNTSPGDSWTIVAGEKSQFEVSEVLVRIEKAIMHDYTHFAGECDNFELIHEHVLVPSFVVLC